MNQEKKDLMVMKFLHYFITQKNYNPVIVHGVQNEIWLENMDSDIRIIRIVMGYIHNKEQLDFDNFKVGRLTKQIKLKTFTFKMKVLTLYLDLNDDLELVSSKNNLLVNVKNEASIKNAVDKVNKVKHTIGSNIFIKIGNLFLILDTILLISGVAHIIEMINKTKLFLK